MGCLAFGISTPNIPLSLHLILSVILLQQLHDLTSTDSRSMAKSEIAFESQRVQGIQRRNSLQVAARAES